ncbi:MAG TPA: Ig-like domain-containing protein, partial [Gemmatimonadales bacterium]|nr:Ig-like domain-containing protein [Gemmatimonadales bacterium]
MGLAAALGLGGCDGGTEPAIPANITLAPPSLSFNAVGQSQQLTPTVSDQQGNTLSNAGVNWSTSNAAVAAVSTNGTVTAQGIGSAEVTATAGSATAVVPVEVIQAPTQLQKLSGDDQIGIAGQQLPEPLVVKVDDAQGNPVGGATVTFTVTQGGGSLGTPSATTGPDGRASTTFTPGPVAGAPQLVAASVPTASISAVFTATAIAGPPASIAVAAGNNQQAAANSPVPTPPAVLVRDANDNPVSGVPVTFEVVSGGGSITGASTTTNNSGIAQAGSWTLGPAGSNVLRATAAGSGISGNPVTFTVLPSGSSFDILVRFLGEPTPGQRQAVADAQVRWENLIVSDLENVRLTAAAGRCGSESPAVNDLIDDVMIFITLQPIDGPGGVLGSAGPCFIRNSNDLTVLGAMRLDSEDLDDIEAEGLLEAVILHEMGHVLGFGSLWSLQGLLADPSLPEDEIPADPHFTGAQAITAFNEVGGAAYPFGKVPVEDIGG